MDEKEKALISRKFAAMQFFDTFKDRLAWAPPFVTFKSQESAIQFKRAYPEFTVQVARNPNTNR